MIVGARWVCLSISITFHVGQPLKFTQDGAMKKKHKVSSSSADGNALLLGAVKLEWPNLFKLTKRFHYVKWFTNLLSRKAYQNAQDTNFEADALQQGKIISGSTSVHQEPKAKAAWVEAHQN